MELKVHTIAHSDHHVIKSVSNSIWESSLLWGVIQPLNF